MESNRGQFTLPNHETLKSLSRPGTVDNGSVAISNPTRYIGPAHTSYSPPMPVGGALKRLLDVTGAITGILLFAPLMVIIALLLTLEGGPVLFAHNRVGFGGKRFQCLKFRSMVVDAEKRLYTLLEDDAAARRQWTEEQKLDNDPRVTRLGKFLRGTSLDELPQFLNVLKGDMSLVGPRPITETEMSRYSNNIEFYLTCRPGVTGAWQISGRSDTGYVERVALDTDYAKTQSFFRDLVILIKTVFVVLSKKGAK